MTEHRVVIERTGDIMLRWSVRIDNTSVGWATTRWGAIRLAKRKLRALDTEAEVYMVKDGNDD